jgi:hypothetical protein
VTVQLPPPDRLYAVRVVVPGDPTQEAIDGLAKKLSAKSAEGLRRGCSFLMICASPDGRAAQINVTVNDWHPGAAVIRVTSLLIIKAGAEWDTTRMTVIAGPQVDTVRSRPDSNEQGQTTTNAA